MDNFWRQPFGGFLASFSLDEETSWSVVHCSPSPLCEGRGSYFFLPWRTRRREGVLDFLDADFADFIVGFIDAIFQMAFQVKTLTCPRCKHLRPVLRLCPSAEQLGHGEALGVF